MLVLKRDPGEDFLISPHLDCLPVNMFQDLIIMFPKCNRSLYTFHTMVIPLNSTSSLEHFTKSVF